jgi:hypothetical protein
MKEGVGEKKFNMTFLVIAVIVVLAAILIYAFIIKPSYSGYVTNLQSQATNQEDFKILNAILNQVNRTGYLTLPIPGTNNQTVVLILPQLCNQLMANNSK